jgi:2-phosphosulfolactate phosphatase
MATDQSDFQVRCEWGQHGLDALTAGSDVIVIVDVLSFSTAVEVAVARGASVYPFHWDDERAPAFAERAGAVIAGRRGAVSEEDEPGSTRYSLSPASLAHIPAGTRLVLPSPNGGALSLHSNGGVPVIAGCLRNASAVARATMAFGAQVSVIPAGERWPDGTLRFAIEDWLGAGAIIAHLSGSRSSEASLAAAAFQAVQPTLAARLMESASGRELIERGHQDDVALAAEHDVSMVVPVLQDGAFVAQGLRSI